VSWIAPLAGALIFQAQAFMIPPGCFPTSQIYKLVQGKYQEERVFTGVSGSFLYEVFVSPDGKTWSIISTSPIGYSCFKAAGEFGLIFRFAVPGDDL